MNVQVIIDGIEIILKNNNYKNVTEEPNHHKFKKIETLILI